MYVNLWPNYLHLADYIRGNGFPTWSFNVGIGTSIISGSLFRVSLVDPFSLTLIGLGKPLLTYLFAHLFVLKIILAGGLFFGYLRLMRFSNLSSLLGAVSFAFSGQMILRGGWFHYGTEMVFLPILLIAIELFSRRGTPILLLGAFGWLAIYNPVLVYFYGIFATFYFLFRNALGDATQEGGWLKGVLRFWLWIVLGTGVGAVIAIPIIAELAATPRLSGEAAPLFAGGLASITGRGEEHLTSFLRLFSNDLLGGGTNYGGWGNYLDAPALYIGLLALLIIPQFFLLAGSKQKRVFTVTFVVAILYFVVPNVRFLLNGFTDYHYKLTSFMVTFFMIYAFVSGLELVKQRGLHTRGFLATLLCLLLPITVMASSTLLWGETTLDYQATRQVIVFLTIYGAAVIASHFIVELRGQRVLLIFAAIFLIEMGLFSFRTVNDRQTLSLASLANESSYFDGSEQVSDAIRKKDSGFFRIAKDYKSVFCCGDALVQDYKGTDTYQSFNQGSYYRFLQAMGLSKPDDFAFRSFSGLEDHYHLYNLLGVKYLVSKTGPLFPGYAPAGSVGGLKYYENQLALPVGFGYYSHLTEKQFFELPRDEREAALYKGFVADPKFPTACSTPEVNYGNQSKMENINEFATQIRSMQSGDSLVVSTHGQKTISGIIELRSPGLVFFSVPHSPGWQLTIDGQETTLQQVNFGFLGACAQAGKHQVSLSYRPPYFGFGVAVSLLSIVSITAILRRKKYAKNN